MEDIFYSSSFQLYHYYKDLQVDTKKKNDECKILSFSWICKIYLSNGAVNFRDTVKNSMENSVHAIIQIVTQKT